MAGIPTSNILQPGAISITGGANRALVSQLQLLKPAYYNKYTEKYGNEDFTWWLATYGGMEKALNRDYFWFENRGKLMIAVSNLNQVSAPAAGAIVNNLQISAADYYSTTQAPLRNGETVYIASNFVEGVISNLNTATPGAFTFSVTPKRSDYAFAGPTGNLEAGEILYFGGDMDAGEASDTIAPQIHLDQKYQNSITEMRETWSATDTAEMTAVYYDDGISGDSVAGGAQAGYSLFTYKGLIKSNTRYKDYIEQKLMFGDVVTNPLITNGTVGSQGVVPKILQDGETIGYTPGTLDIPKIHEITRIMDVNGCVNQAMWLADIFQRQNFTDGIFKEFPAGAFVWGQGEKSQDASLAFGFQSLLMDGYLFNIKKYKFFNGEVRTGKTALTDRYRDFGIICPNGETRDAKDASKVYKNLTIMYMDPPKGGTTGNGIRVWPWGGGSMNPTTGKMNDNVEQICYRGTRVVAANQFLIVEAA